MEILPSITINHYVIISIILFCIGIMGVLIRRNAIIMFMCVELMLNAVNLLLVGFSQFWGDGKAQVFVFFIMAVAAAEVAVGLAILMMIYRNQHSSDIEVLKRLKW
jgi:NADH-quinone oxidoreductase subunit K